MNAASRGLALGAAVLALACGDIASPTRNDLYEWRLETPSIPGPGLDTLSFHWSRDDLPVRVWVEDAIGLPGHVARAIGVWEGAFLYGEFAGTLVGDSTTADVIVREGSPIEKSRGLRLHSAFAPECTGATDLDVDVAELELNLPIRVYIDPRTLPEDPGFEPCLALTSIHEMGHAIGILAHSEDPDDIMFADPVVELPSDRDRHTAEVAYHTPANLQPIRP